MAPLFVLPFTLLVVFASSTSGDQNFFEIVTLLPRETAETWHTSPQSPAGMFGGKAPLRLAAQKSKLHAPSVPMRSAPAFFLCKWGVHTRLH
jgi:hypothetical protein